MQPVILKKGKKISALHHIQLKPIQRQKQTNKQTKIDVLSTSCPLHGKTIDDGKDNP